MKSARTLKHKEEPHSCLGWQHPSASTLQKKGGGHDWWGTALDISLWAPSQTAQLSAWPQAR